VPLLHPSIDEAKAMWAESTGLASILFSYAAGHNKDFSVVHIYNKVPQFNQLFHDKAKHFLWITQFTHTRSVAKIMVIME
jgi:hypothetical protein